MNRGLPTLSVHRTDGRGWGNRFRLYGTRCLFPGEEAAFAEDFFAEFGFQLVAEEEAAVGGVADAEFCDQFFGQAAALQIFAGAGAFGAAQRCLKKATARS